MSNYWLCRSCGKIYDINAINSFQCPDVSCNSLEKSLIELDELMLYPIKILYEKGYVTYFSCSGHAFNNNLLTTYIVFDETYKPDSAPNNWYIEENCIRCKEIDYDSWRKMSEIKRQEIIFQRMTDLYKWVEELPICESENLFIYGE